MADKSSVSKFKEQPSLEEMRLFFSLSVNKLRTLEDEVALQWTQVSNLFRTAYGVWRLLDKEIEAFEKFSTKPSDTKS